MIDLDHITNEVAETRGVIDSALTFIAGLAQKLRDALAAGTNDGALQTSIEDLANQLDAKQNELAAAIVENPDAGGTASGGTTGATSGEFGTASGGNDAG